MSYRNGASDRIRAMSAGDEIQIPGYLQTATSLLRQLRKAIRDPLVGEFKIKEHETGVTITRIS